MQYFVYIENFDTREKAVQREMQLKKWKRSKKEALINGDFIKLKNLSKKEFKKNPFKQMPPAPL
ncbi:MAG TPA: endonuclease [Lentisphaeria bacterium]|nr:MAG: hypothetical protein A2X48_08585 [Lentisphaerae bacterium GWF2_49_21]HBC88645.1 endonuclease [Lentisphaeria bacterium]